MTTNDGTHWIHCVLLSATSELLACGLDDLLEEGMSRIPPLPPITHTNTNDTSNSSNDNNKGITNHGNNASSSVFQEYHSIEEVETHQYASLVRLAVVLVMLQKKEIRRTLQRLLAHASTGTNDVIHELSDPDFVAIERKYQPLHSSGVPLNNTNNTSASNNNHHNDHSSISSSSSPSYWKYATIEKDSNKGRNIVSEQALGSGVSVCRDQPFALCIAAACQCRYHHHQHSTNNSANNRNIRNSNNNGDDNNNNNNNNNNCTTNKSKSIVMPLLVEHLALAASLYAQHTQSTTRAHQHSTDHDTCTNSEHTSNHHKHSLRPFFTLLDGHLTSANTEAEEEIHVQLPWSPSQLRIFAVLSALTVFIMNDDAHSSHNNSNNQANNSYTNSWTTTLMNTTLNHTTTNSFLHVPAEEEDVEDLKTQFHMTDAAYKSFMTQQALLFFRILVRLPTNTHAVSTLLENKINHKTTFETVTNNNNENNSSYSSSVMSSKVVAYAVFLQASAINHSCDANATIQYQFAKSNNTNTNKHRNDTNKNSRTNSDGTNNSLKVAQNLLSTLSINITTTKSVAYHEDISVCYGPLYPRHSYAQRQHALRAQYLFHCQCTACVQEAQQLVLEKQQQQRQRRIIDNGGLDVSVQQEKEMLLQRVQKTVQMIQDNALEINVVVTTLLTNIEMLQAKTQLDDMNLNMKTSSSTKMKKGEENRTGGVKIAEDVLLEIMTENLKRLHVFSQNYTRDDESNTEKTKEGGASSYKKVRSSSFHVSFPPVSSSSSTSILTDALQTLFVMTQVLQEELLFQRVIVPAFGEAMLLQLFVLDCDDDDAAAAERFKNLDFRRYLFPVAYTNTFQHYPTLRTIDPQIDATVFTPLHPVWKDVIALWCLLLDLQAQILSSFPPIDEKMTKNTGPYFLHAAKRLNFATNLMIAGGLYGHQDIVIARERVKMSSLYLSAGDWQRSRRRALLALPVLRIHCGGNASGVGNTEDPDLVEVLHILELTERLEKPAKKQMVASKNKNVVARKSSANGPK